MMKHKEHITVFTTSSNKGCMHDEVVSYILKEKDGEHFTFPPLFLFPERRTAQQLLKVGCLRFATQESNPELPELDEGGLTTKAMPSSSEAVG